MIDTDEVVSFAEKRAGIIGGFVISGGEPTLQNDLPEFIKRIKS